MQGTTEDVDEDRTSVGGHDGDCHEFAEVLDDPWESEDASLVKDVSEDEGGVPGI